MAVNEETLKTLKTIRDTVQYFDSLNFKNVEPITYKIGHSLYVGASYTTHNGIDVLFFHGELPPSLKRLRGQVFTDGANTYQLWYHGTNLYERSGYHFALKKCECVSTAMPITKEL